MLRTKILVFGLILSVLGVLFVYPWEPGKKSNNTWEFGVQLDLHYEQRIQNQKTGSGFWETVGNELCMNVLCILGQVKSFLNLFPFGNS